MAAKIEGGGGDGGEVKKVLSAVNDHYGGVIVHVTEHMEPATFASSLTSSIAHWKLQGKKGVWIGLPIERVNLVEAAVKITYDILGRSELQQGFWHHHAEPDYLMLVNWIPQSPHTLPTNATHRVGIGAFLINQIQNREVLVVQENGGQYRGTVCGSSPLESLMREKISLQLLSEK